MKKHLFAILTCLSLFSVKSQTVLINQPGIAQVNNGGKFYDAGGPTGNDGNTSYTKTLCPSTPGEMVALDFVSFKTHFNDQYNEEDALFIYNGTSATGNDIGKLMGDYSVKYNTGVTPYAMGVESNGSFPLISTPTIFSSTDPSGCLTLKFLNGYSGSSSTWPGWEANIITYPLITPGCNITLTADKTTICPGETVNLTSIGALTSTAMNNNFNNSSVGTNWQTSIPVTFTNNACSKPNNDGSIYVWMQNNVCPRTLATNTFDVSNGGTISFDYRQATGNGDASPCEAPDQNGGTFEGVYLQYSTNNGSSWTTFKYLFPNATEGSFGSEGGLTGCGDYVKGWTTMTYPIPAAAKTVNTQFRWIQSICTNASSDNWGLDNVIISTTKPTTIRLKRNAANGPVIASSSTSPLNFAVNPTATTTYFATISDGVDSCTQQVTVNVGVPVTTAIPSACNPVNNQYSVSGTHTFTNAPTTGTLTISNSCGGTPFTQNAPFTSPINYSITGLTSNGSNCTITATFSANTNCNSTITYTAPSNCTSVICPTASISYNGPFCTSLSTAQNVTLTGTGTNTGGTYSSTSGLSINSSTGAIIPSTSSAGSYTVTYTIAASGGCAAVTATTTVVIKALPTATIAYSGPYCTSLTTPQGVTLTGTNNSGGTYSSTSGLTINSSTGAITPSTSTAGTYTVTYTIAAGGGCAAVTATTSVVITALPTATISYAGPFCKSITAAQNVTISGTGAYTGGAYSSTAGLTINSSTGAITPSSSIPGTYTVTYTISASAGCGIVTATTTVVIDPILIPVISCGTSTSSTVSFTWPAVTGATAYTVSYQINSNAAVNVGTIGNVLTYSRTGLNASDNVIITVTPTGGTSPCFGLGTQTCQATNCVPPTANISYAGTPFCKSLTTGQAVTISGTNGTNDASVAWNYTGGTYSSTTGLSINSSTGEITPSTSSAGNYTVTYTIPASGNCSLVTVTTPIVITAVPTATISYAGPFCKSITAAQNVTISGTGAYTGGAYSSTAGLTINSSTGAITPSTSTPGSYTVTYTIPASAGCDIVTATSTVVIDPILTPVISCGTSTSSSVSFTWSAVTGATAYTVSYQINSNAVVNVGTIGNVLTYSSTGLNASDNVIITVTPTGGTSPCFGLGTQTCQATNCVPPTANISYAGTPFCKSLTTGQAVTISGTNGTNDASVAWNYTGGTYSSTTGLSINSTTGDITPSTSTAGNYTVTYTIPASGSCSLVTVTAIVEITNSITPTFTQLGPYCLNSTQVTLPLASTNNPAINGTWNTASISTTTAGITSYTFTPSSGQCAGTTTMDVEINPLPIVSFNASPISGCSPLKTSFTNNSTDVQSVVWNFGNGQTSTLLNPIDIVYIQSGCYDVTLTVISTDQCTNTLTQNDIVCVDVSPTADFSTSNSIISSENSSVTFLNQSENATTYSWNFGDGSNSTLTSPSHNFNTSNNQNFTIELVAYSQNGCTDTSYTVIQIEEEEIYYVPNSFTPDGNEFNNIFKPIFNNQISEENYSLLIFNRWGELIFESNEKNKGWDGTYNNEKCKNDTYTWKIIFSNIKNDDRKEIVGHVNLLY